MTLDEAIKHAEEVAEKKKEEAWEAQLQEEYGKVKSCKECAEEHRQLAEWLKELKLLREQKCEDAINRQAVLEMASTIQTDDFSGNETIEVVDVDDIKALPPVTPKPKSECEHDHEILKAHSDGANAVLDNIRAEIAKEAKCTMNDNRAGGLYKALQIIDKYAEGSDKE